MSNYPFWSASTAAIHENESTPSLLSELLAHINQLEEHKNLLLGHRSSLQTQIDQINQDISANSRQLKAFNEELAPKKKAALNAIYRLRDHLEATGLLCHDLIEDKERQYDLYKQFYSENQDEMRRLAQLNIDLKAQVTSLQTDLQATDEQLAQLALQLTNYHAQLAGLDVMEISFSLT